MAHDYRPGVAYDHGGRSYDHRVRRTYDNMGVDMYVVRTVPVFIGVADQRAAHGSDRCADQSALSAVRMGGVVADDGSAASPDAGAYQSPALQTRARHGGKSEQGEHCDSQQVACHGSTSFLLLIYAWSASLREGEGENASPHPRGPGDPGADLLSQRMRSRSNLILSRSWLSTRTVLVSE